MRNKVEPPPKPRSRKYLKLFGKIVVPLLFDFEIVGEENYPESGPLILVGNHEGAMEAVLMGAYPPYDVEMLAGSEFPQEKIVKIAKSLYGVIHVKRMFMDKGGLEKSLAVLENNGVVGIFPEGGVWNAGAMEPKLGAAWLSYYSRAPVLPIAFSGSKGAWNKAIRFKRPKLQMSIGKVIDPIQKVDKNSKKSKMAEYSNNIWHKIDKMLPGQKEVTTNHEYTLKIDIQDQNKNSQKIPAKIKIEHTDHISQLIHNPGIIKLLDVNLKLPVEVFKNTTIFYSARKYICATQELLKYLDDENPYLLLYRVGVKKGLQIKAGLEELNQLAHWCEKQNFKIQLTALHQYYHPDRKQKIIDTAPDKFGKWI